MDTNSSQFLETFNFNARKIIKKAYDTVVSFLPKDASSPWPKEVRKCSIGWCGTQTLVAFDGTMGASAAFGGVVEPFLKDHHKWLAGMSEAQRDVYTAITDKNWLKERINLSVKTIKNRLSSHALSIYYRFTFNEETYIVLTQDILRMCRIASSFRNEEVILTKISEMQDINGWYNILTFSVGVGVYVHILSAHRRS